MQVLEFPPSESCRMRVSLELLEIGRNWTVITDQWTVFDDALCKTDR
jgi:hypothetical protein